MIEFLTNIVSHPYSALIVVLTVVAVLAFLYFFWGFTGYILAHGDVEHQHIARMRMAQGIALLLSTVVVWEIIRSIANYFS